MIKKQKCLLASLGLPQWLSGKASGWRIEGLGIDPYFMWLNQTPGHSGGHPARHMVQCVVSSRTVWPGLSTLPLVEIASLICSFCLSVEACTPAQADP